MTRKELIQAVADKSEVNIIDVDHVINSYFAVVIETISSREPIHVRGFGTMGVKTKGPKKARDIGRNTSIMVPEHGVVFFKPAPDFKKRVR